MKKFLSMCLAFTMTLALPLGASAAVKPKLPEAGAKVEGFTVAERGVLELTGDETVLFEHDKTGAQVFYIASEDINRYFGIAFKTPKLNNKGVQHVFEHSTLAGSEKYPSQNIWFPVTNRTYNTFMNAMTSDAVTMYPFMSLSEEQLIKLADLYLDSVFNPMLYDEERIYRREAWRYELADAESPVIITGTVYNEMKGSSTLESAAAYENTPDALFPGSIIQNSVGGRPEEITDITWEDLTDYHSAYYHPSNSLTVLYGDLDYAKFLKLLNEEYFSEYEEKEIEIETGMIEPRSKPVEKTYYFPMETTAKTEDASVISYSIAADGAASEEMTALDFALTLLNHESSPFAAELREKLPGATVSLTGNMFAAPIYYAGFTANGVDPEDKELFKSIIDKNIAAVIKDGFNKELVDAVLAQTKLSFLFTADQANLGMGLATTSIFYWAAYGELDYYNDYLKAMEVIEAKADGGYLEGLLEKYFVNNNHKAVTITVPDPGKAEENAAELAAELAEMKAAMTEEEIDALVAETEDMAQWSMAEPSPELLKPLQVITVDNLPEEVVSYEINERDADGVHYMTAVANVSDVGQTNLLFNTSAVPLEDLHYLKLYTDLIGSVGTENHSIEEINILITRYLAGLSVFAGYISNEDEDYTPVINASWLNLNEDYAAGAELFNEIMFTSDMTDTETIKNVVARLKTSMRNTITNSAYLILMDKAYATAHEKYAYSDHIGGTAYYQFLVDAEAALKNDPKAFSAKLASVAEKFAVRDKINALYAGNAEGVKVFEENIGAAFDGLAEGTITAVKYGPEFNAAGSEAMILDSAVQYNAIYASLEELGLEDSGKLLPIGSIIYDLYLTPQVRHDIGAYGVIPFMDEDGVGFVSYMDPSVAETYSVYEGLAGFINGLEITQEEVDNYIIQSYSGYAMPEGAMAGAMNALMLRLSGKPDDEKLQTMREMKTLTVKDIKDLADEFEKLADDGYRATAGGASAIEANADLFEQVVDINAMGE